MTEPDLYYKEESFNSGETNICFILGHSGSGKSKMARMLEGGDIDHIELDDLLLVKDHFTMEELENYSDMFSSFFKGEGAKYYIGIEERENLPKEEYEDKVFIDFVRYAMDFAKTHKEKKYIVEGIWIYLYFDDPSVFEDYAVFIKGTSFLKSKIRTMKREMQRDKEVLKERKQMFGREVRNYLLDEDKINVYRSYFGTRPETIFREETGSAAPKTIDELLETPYWIIDILPKQVPAASEGQFFAVEKYFLEESRFAEIKKKHINLILKLNCYWNLTIDEETELNPAPEKIAEEMQKRALYLRFRDAMILSEPDDTHMTVFNPDKQLLELIRTIATGEGLFVWRP